MKTTKLFLLALGTTFLISSCGGKKEEVQEEKVDMKTNPFSALQKMGQDMQAGANKQEEMMKKRRAKGDTLAMPYADLQKYLPPAPAGFKADPPNGTNLNMGPTSYSTADVTYKKDNGDWIKVTIMDYNQAGGLFTAATGMWGMGLSIDSQDEKTGGIKFDGDIAGWETYKKKSKDAAVTLGVGYRFWVSVEANNQESSENVKSIAKTLDLKKLSEL